MNMYSEPYVKVIELQLDSLSSFHYKMVKARLIQT